MSVEELIQKLSKFPPHYNCEVWMDGVEVEDYTAEIVDVQNFNGVKTVSIEINNKP